MLAALHRWRGQDSLTRGCEHSTVHAPCAGSFTGIWGVSRANWRTLTWEGSCIWYTQQPWYGAAVAGRPVMIELPYRKLEWET